MTTIASAPPKPSLLTNRPYLLLWVGQSLSFLGDYCYTATLTIWIIASLAKGASWLPLAAGGVALAGTLPSLVVAPLAGVFVDRWDRRQTMIGTDLLRLVLVALFLLLTLLSANHDALLVGALASVLLVACGSQFFLPAREAIVAELVSPEQYPSAYGSLHQARYLAQILGPSLAAPLYLAFGPTWAILLNAASFGVSGLLLWLIRLPGPATATAPKPHAPFWQAFREGFRFFVGNRVLVTLLISGMLFMLGGMAYNTFEYLYGVEHLHIPGPLLGLYVGCYGVGVVLSLPVTAALARRSSEVEVLWLFLLGSGLTMLVLSRMTTWAPGMVCGFLLGVFSSSILISVRPLTVLVTPRALIGRVMSFEVPMITAASLLGGVLASTLASTVLAGFHATFAGLTFGRLDTIFVLVGVLTIGSGMFARVALYPAVKAVRAQQTREKEDALAGSASGEAAGSDGFLENPSLGGGARASARGLDHTAIRLPYGESSKQNGFPQDTAGWQQGKRAGSFEEAKKRQKRACSND